MKQKLSEYLDIVNDSLAAINYPQEPDTLYAPIRYELSLGGKRIRPVLMLMACELFGGDINQAISPAMGLEIFHNTVARRCNGQVGVASWQTHRTQGMGRKPRHPIGRCDADYRHSTHSTSCSPFAAIGNGNILENCT